MTVISDGKKESQTVCDSNSSSTDDGSCREKRSDRKNGEKQTQLQHPKSDANSYWLRTGKQLTAGALSGWCDASITYPTEYVKVMLQLQEKGKEKRFANASDVVRQTIRCHGPLGMYRGFSVVFIGNVPKYMCRFGSYEQIKTLFIDSNGHLSPLNKMLCGLGAGVVEALFAVVPQDSVKIKFINDRVSQCPKYRGLLHGVREIVRERGLTAMYTGVLPTLLKQSSNQAIRFFVFESLKDWWSGSTADGNACNEVHRALIPLFGLLAGCASVLFNTPLDVIKTRMQGLQGHQYRGTVDCIRQMYGREGVLSFYKGVSLRLLKVSMECMIAFTVYNYSLELFGVK